MGGERCHRGQDARAHHGNREIETSAESRRGKCATAQTADHDRVRKPHRRLRQIGGGQRAGDGDGGAHLRDQGIMYKHPENKALSLLSGENISATPFARIVTPLPSWPTSVRAIHDPRPKKKTWMRGTEPAHDDLSHWSTCYRHVLCRNAKFSKTTRRLSRDDECRGA